MASSSSSCKAEVSIDKKPSITSHATTGIAGPNIDSGAPLTTFEPFLRLPIELQLQVIKHAWVKDLQTFNRDIRVICFDCPEDNRPRLYFQDAELPALCLVSKSFLTECRFLTRPYLINVPSISGSKCIPFIPHLDHVLYLETTGRPLYDFFLICYFNAIPSELRQKLKHVRVNTLSEEEALRLFHRQKCYKDIARVVRNLDMPLLESFTVVGMNQHKLKRMKLWDRMDFEVKRDGSMVRVDWMSV
jgi:hypothetical protein